MARCRTRRGRYAEVCGGNEDAPPEKKRRTSLTPGDATQDGPRGALDSLRQQCGLEKPKGAPIDEGLAEVLNTLATEGLSETAIAERKSKVAEIENCDKLVAPRVNECVWDAIKDGARKQDSALQNTQKTILKGLMPIIRLGDSFLKAVQGTQPAPEAKDAFEAITDGVALVLAGSHSLSIKRRDFLRPQVRTDFKAIFSTKCPMTTELFGDDLPKRLKDITDTNKIGMRVADPLYRPSISPRGSGGFRPYSRSMRGRGFSQFRSRACGRGSFLGQSRPPRRGDYSHKAK